MDDRRKTKAELIGELTALRRRVHDLEKLVTEHYEIREPGYRTIHDAITGLPGKPLFDDRLAMAASHAKRYKKTVVVMIVYVNDLKKVSSNLGGYAADQLMKAFADRLSATLRRADTIARIDENDFGLVLLDIARPKSITEVAWKILNVFKKPFLFQDYTIQVNLNIGIAVFPRDGEEIEILVENAYSAMEQSKKIGDNTFYYFTSMRNLDNMVGI